MDYGAKYDSSCCLSCCSMVLHPKVFRKRKIAYSMSSEREWIRDEIMICIMNSEISRNIVKIGPLTFLKLAKMLEREGGLKRTQVWKNNLQRPYICQHIVPRIVR